MNENTQVRPVARAFFAGLFALLVAIPIAAQTPTPPSAPVVQHDDDDDDANNSDKRKYQPMPVNSEVFNAHDEWFVATARKIQNGTAKTIERRAWYELKKRYYPFTADAIPPRDWRIRAFEQAMKLDGPPAAARGTIATQAAVTPQAVTDYSWSGLGMNVSWAQGQPPSAAPNTDYGAGRATALWVNPNNKADVLLGFADGGLWKSTNVSNTINTATWTPLTDFVPSLSVGSVVARVSATDSNRIGPNTTIWLATGEGNFSSGDVQGVGVLKSIDGGATWSLKQVPWVVASDGTSMFDRTSIRRIALDGRNPNNLWLAADSGIFRSTDAGETWRLVVTLPYWKKYAGDCWYVYYSDVVIDDTTPAAGQPSHVYVAHGRTGDAGCSTVSREDNAIFRTTDDGVAWVNISAPSANCPGTVAATTSRGYTCVGSGFAASGLTNSTTVAGTVGRMTIAMAPNDKKHLYVLIQNTTNSNSLGIWEAANASGATVAWTARATTDFANGQGWYNLSGAVNPTNAAQVIVGGLEAYVSSNNAGTINRTSNWSGWGTADYAHADHHQLVWVDNTTIYLAHDGGFSVGTVANAGAAGGVDWVENVMGAMTMQGYGIGQSATNANAIHVGVQDNGQPKVILDSLAAGNITGWWEIRGGDGGFSGTDRTNHAIAYNEYVYGQVYQTTNAVYTGTAAWTWTCIRNFGACACAAAACNPDNATQFIAPFTLDRNNQARAYLPSRKVYRWNGGTTWVSYSPDLTTTNNANSVNWVHSAFNNGVSGRLWAVTENGRVWTTGNATADTADSATWTDTTKAPLPNRSANWVESHPLNGTWAIVAFGGFNTAHIFRTKDGGTTWTDISGELPNEPFDAIAVDPADPNRVFIGSDFGVFVNEDGWNGSTWRRINNGQLPYQKIYQLDFSPANGKLRAVTHGRGIWELTIAAGSGCAGGVPAAPTGVTATTSSGQVTLSWTAVAGATSYKVYRVDGGSCPTSELGRVVGSGITGTTFVDVTSCSGTYKYAVIAVSAGNCESVPSSCTSVTMPAMAAPASLTVTPAASGQLTLSWSAVAGASRYEVWRYNNSSCPAPNNGTQVASNVSATSYTDTALTNGTPYAYYVRALSSCPAAPFSPCATGTPTACTLPAAPASVSATATAPNRITVTWSAVAGATSYKVYRAAGECMAPNGSYTLLTSGVVGTSYNDATAVFGNRYSYKVVTTTACDSALSTACAWAEAYGDCVNAPTFAGAATAATGAGGTCGINLTWAAGSSNCPGSGSISYTIYRGTTAAFVPAAANRIVAGVSGVAYTDTNGLQANATYYYKVRAVDSRNNVEDTNSVERTAAAQSACSAAPYDVQVFSITSTGGAGATTGQNVLHWVNPASGVPGTTVRVNFRTDTFPTGPTDSSATVLFTGRPVTFGAKDSYTHTGLTNGTTYYYAIWILY
jgi:fibronectin type 3 domain-containing protein